MVENGRFGERCNDLLDDNRVRGLGRDPRPRPKCRSGLRTRAALFSRNRAELVGPARHARGRANPGPSSPPPRASRWCRVDCGCHGPPRSRPAALASGQRPCASGRAARPRTAGRPVIATRPPRPAIRPMLGPNRPPERPGHGQCVAGVPRLRASGPTFGLRRVQVTDGANESNACRLQPYATASSEISEYRRVRESRLSHASKTWFRMLSCVTS